MIIPLLFILGLAYVGSQVGKSLNKSGVHYQPPVISGTFPPPGVSGTGRAYTGVIRAEYQLRPFLRLLKHRISKHLPITKFLVGKALDEAMRCNDVGTIITLSRLLAASPKHRIASPKHRQHRAEVETEDPDAEDVGETDAIERESEGPAVEQEQPAESLEGLGQEDLQSPLPGISNEDWMEFIARVRTKPPGYKSDKYIGQYEQNRSRLKQLGIPEPTTPEQEHDALASDIATHAEDFAELDRDHSGDMLALEGNINPDSEDGQHPICASGILGLLKYAGPEGARSWLKKPEDRKKYPKTTEAFLRTNGLF